MSMIPNPKKNVVVDFTVTEIKSALVKIPTYFKNKYSLEKKNDLLNQFTFSALEFLSLGVYIDINLSFISETKTDIIVEIRRKLGAFDQWYEVQKANQHIESLFNGISVLLTNIRQAQVQVDTENPVSTVNFSLPWVDVKRHLGKFLSTYPNSYKTVLENNSPEEIVLRRLPQKGDNVEIDIDAIIKITKSSTNENSPDIRFEITNENNKITTHGELNRNTLILKITINLLTKIISELRTKIAQEETKLENLKKWKIGRNRVTKEQEISAQTKLIETLKHTLKQGINA